MFCFDLNLYYNGPSKKYSYLRSSPYEKFIPADNSILVGSLFPDDNVIPSGDVITGGNIITVDNFLTSENIFSG